jgi:hypothetical protein
LRERRNTLLRDQIRLQAGESSAGIPLATSSLAHVYSCHIYYNVLWSEICCVPARSSYSAFVREEANFESGIGINSRTQWPCGPRRGSAVARLLGSWIRIPLGTWISVFCECCMLSGSLCVGLIARPQKSYRMWCL